MPCATSKRPTTHTQRQHALTARGLYKSYRNGGKTLRVIKGIDLDVGRGEVLFIVGPSGAGKSTLLHILAGLDKPDKGNVILGGDEIYKLRDRKRSKLRNENVGFVFQFYHLLPEFSVMENVMLPAMMRRRPDISGARKRAGDILSGVGLSERMRHRPSELSGGEQQRAAIARALINSPDILFCDEPTGNLDSESGGAVYDLIFSLSKKEDITIVVVSHQDDFAGRATRRLGIKDGILSECML